MPELLRVDNLSKRFGHYQALSDISFCVNSNEILGIIGPNGSGKTTLMECMTGLLPIDKGAIYWKQEPLSIQHARQNIYYLPDGILPYSEQTVGIVIRFFQKLYGATKTQLSVLLERLELSSMLTIKVQSLSKGYRRRLLLLIGLLSPQSVLMLDEPFDGFDLRQTMGVMALLRETLVGRTLLLCIHQLSEAEKICDRFLLLNAGKVAAIGTLAQLQKQAGMESGGLEEVFLALV